MCIAESLFCYCQKILFWGNQVLHHGIAKNWQKQNWTLIFLGGNSVFFWGTVILADDSTKKVAKGHVMKCRYLQILVVLMFLLQTLFN